MGIIVWIIFGALVGWIASMIMGVRGGVLLDIAMGIVGAVIGGWLMSLIGYGKVNSFNLYGFFVALLGAIVLIAAVRTVRR